MRFTVLAVTSFLVGVYAFPAAAGFTWTPSQTSSQMAASEQVSAPVAEALSPVPLDVESMAAPVTVAPQPQSAPVYQNSKPVIAAPMQVTPFEAPAVAAPMVAPVAASAAPVALSTQGYEKPVEQKNAIRPIRIDTRPALSMPAAPVNVAPVMAAPLSLSPAPFMHEKTVPIATTEKTPQQADSVQWAPANTLPFAPTNLSIAEGFGRDIPLAMAVRQIVPDSYGLSYDRSVSMDQTVSWEGGADWLSVLNASLAPQNLQASLQGQVVRIRSVAVPTRLGQSVTTTKETLVAGMEMVPQTGTQTPTNLPTTIAATAPIAAPVTPAAAPQQAATAMPLPQQPMAIEPAAGSVSQAEMPVPMMDMVAPAAGGDIQMYTAQRGMSLRETLEAWCAQAGVELHWASQYDYPLVTDVQLEGSFEAVTKNLLKGFEESRPKPTGRLHPNLPNGPAVLIIETRD